MLAVRPKSMPCVRAIAGLEYYEKLPAAIQIRRILALRLCMWRVKITSIITMPPKRKRSSDTGTTTITYTEPLSLLDASYASQCLLSLKNMLDNKELCDITLNVQGRAFKCHRTVLAMGSPFFHKLFTSGMRDARQDTVELPEVRNASLAPCQLTMGASGHERWIREGSGFPVHRLRELQGGGTSGSPAHS